MAYRRDVGCILLTVLSATACSEPGPGLGASFNDVSTGPPPEVLISTEDGLIGRIADLVLDEDGTLYAVDQQASQVHVVEGQGEVRSFGGPGAGPGELARPSTLYRKGDTLLVVDWGNGRLQGLTLLGSPIFTRLLPPGYAPSLGAEGRLVRPTQGMDTMLAVIHAADLSEIAPIGRIVGSPVNTLRFRQMKQDIQEGKVPEFFLNTAESVVAPDSATWLFVEARGSVQRFDAMGGEVFSVTLNEPEREVLLDRFVSENAAKPANSLAGLSYIADATVVGRDLWVLLGSSLAGPAAIRIIHADGRVGGRVEYPNVVGASQLAIDAERGFGYFVKGDEAELVRVALAQADTLPFI